MKPEHVGIILDGNRRFAMRLMKKPWKGHEYGAEKVRKLLDWCKELGIKEMTLYCLSVDNLKSRPKNELRYLLKLMRKELRGLDRKKIDKYKIKIRFLGNLNLLPQNLVKECRKLEKETAKHKKHIINFAIAYGGRQEIMEAVKKILSNKIKPEEINEKVIEKNLYMPDQPDLIIRTGGEMRTSNFLPWQAGYSEWIFLKKMWPEFSKQDLKKATQEFRVRKRRFGK